MTFRNGSNKAALEYTLRYNPPMNLAVAERNLKEAKQILDQLGVVFLLYSGSCLGVTRDNAFIPWDDDIDLVSVMGINGLTERSTDTVMAAFRDKGYFVDMLEGAYSKTVVTIKDFVRLSWDCASIIDDSIYAYPRVRLPAKLFTNPKEIEFLGKKFLVPNPPEEYLRLKYGGEWMVPKKSGEYEKDVVEKVPGEDVVGLPCKLRVLDHEGKGVPNAEVVLVGGKRSRTDELGYAEVTLPGPDWYALVIRYPGHEQVLYMEEIEPGKTYVYRADSASNAARYSQSEIGTLGNLLLLE
jgi:hypothetical protein